MSQTTQTLSRLVIWDFSLTLEDDISPMSMIPWPHRVPRHLCVTIKSSVSGKPAAEWLMPGSAARRRQGRLSNPGHRLALDQRPTHTKKRPLQSFPWFLFWAASMVSTVSQAPPKKWHILRPDASDSQYRAVIISRALFFGPREGAGYF